jgi:hypothetical protein
LAIMLPVVVNASLTSMLPEMGIVSLVDARAR